MEKQVIKCVCHKIEPNSNIQKSILNIESISGKKLSQISCSQFEKLPTPQYIEMAKNGYYLLNNVRFYTVYYAK